MKILFSPSESKSKISSDKKLCVEKLIFPHLYEKRLEILKSYDEFVGSASDEGLCKLFGFKNLSGEDGLRKSIFKKGCAKAVLRYDGTAYQNLCYLNLSAPAQNWIKENVLIFSNLFGILRASDEIPEYKLKQGEKFNGLDLAKFYRQNFSAAIDEILNNDDVIDLRAGFYEKFYDIKKPYTSFKFLKDGKALSHYAKAYRGKILNLAARNLVRTADELIALNFENLRLVDIKKIGLKNELLFEIC